MTTRTPELSVVLVTNDGLASIDKALACLGRQTARDRLEVVVVGPGGNGGGERPPDGLAVRRVEVDRVGSWGQGAAEGTRHASAPVIAFGEEHDYPHPGWAVAIIEGHRGPYPAVGSALRNANPNSVVSWAHFVFAFGPWADPVPSGEVPRLPWHHTSYKRDVLLALGDELGTMLEAEGRLYEELVAKGHSLLLRGDAVSDHVSVSRPSSFLWIEFNGGHLLGGTRALRWGRARRAVYALAAPLIALLRLRRVFGNLARVRSAHPVPLAVAPWLVVAAGASAAGEAYGYVAGLAHAADDRLDMEMHRDRYRGRERMSAGV